MPRTAPEARLVPSRSTGKCKSCLKSFYEPVSANGTAASWDNSRSDGRAAFAGMGWRLISKKIVMDRNLQPEHLGDMNNDRLQNKLSIVS